MAITMGFGGLDAAAGALRRWQGEETPLQLHPGDLGWFCRFGAEATAAAVPTWGRDERILAVGLLDGPGLLRLTIAPDARRDEELAVQVAEDVKVMFPTGRVNVEAPMDALVRELLTSDGWDGDEPWTPLRRDLAGPVGDPGVRVEVVGPEQARGWADVVRASFENSTFGEERWRAMAGGSPYADARCLLGYDDQGNAVAAVAVWSAGPGKPGLLEPMGVHSDHRGRGFGRAISVAAAAALREMGSSSAVVCTPSSNVGGVATYESAGFQPLPEVWDVCRAG